MNCNETRACLSKLDQLRLGERKLDALKTHLERCPACRQLADLEEKIDRILDGLFTEPVPGTLLEEINGPTIRRRVRARQIRAWFGRAAAAAVLVVAIGIPAFWRGNEDDRIRGVLFDSPVRQAAITEPVLRIPEIREQAQLAINVRRIRDNIVWVSIRN